MEQYSSFDIFLLGLKAGTKGGWARYANAMERLTGRSSDTLRATAGRSSEPIFHALDQGTARVVVDTLADAGVLVEIRRTSATASDVRDQVVATMTCPSCDFVQPADGVECSRCGLVFAKFEREQIQSMQKNQNLEQALTKGLQLREEWAQKAARYLETRPLAEGSTVGFESVLVQDEVPFLRLTADEGPILMTSRRLIASLKDGIFSIPYEMIQDVTFGGGLVQKKTRVRMQLGFHSPIPSPSGAVKQFIWQLDKESSFSKDVVMDWAYSRVFMCGSCGSRELDYRLEGNKSRVRCMHCATDHDVDLKEGLAVPISAE